ncbi:MAG: hypothetical protein Q6363_008185 [Candidatus Njordarchaeota archaeon]
MEDSVLYFFFFITWLAILGSSYNNRELKEFLAEVYRSIVVVLMVLANDDYDLRKKVASILGVESLPYEIWEKIHRLFDEVEEREKCCWDVYRSVFVKILKKIR